MPTLRLQRLLVLQSYEKIRGTMRVVSTFYQLRHQVADFAIFEVKMMWRKS